MILGVIPARAGSKGIKDKNIYPLLSKPLIEYTIDAAIRSNLDDVVISTDIENLTGAHIINRPTELCQDDTKMCPVIQHAVTEYESRFNVCVDAVMILQPTSPLRTYEDINKCIELFNSNNKLSLYSGYLMGIKQKYKIYDKHTQEPHFQRNGAIFITKRCLLDSSNLWSNDVIEYHMPLSRSIDIDDMDEMYICESILKNPKEVI